MPNIMAGSLGGLFPKSLDPKLEVVSVLINNACNLSCRHCYLKAPTYGAPLQEAEWTRFFRSLLADVAPAALSIAGKEPFLNAPSVRVVQEAVRQRDLCQQPAHTRIGVITNGTLVHRHAEALQQCAPDYFDISVDGLPEAHDRIRGQGAFRLLEPNLRWLLHAFGTERVWITHTVTSPTATDLPEVIKFYRSTFGVRHFSVGVYQPVTHAASQLTFAGGDLHEFGGRTLDRLGRVRLDGPVEVILDLDVKHPELLAILATGGWIGDSGPLLERVHCFDNGVTLKIRGTTVDVGLWRSVRVTPEGYWLGAEDLMDVDHYDTNAVASLRDMNFDVPRLYEAGLQRYRCGDLMRSKDNTLLEGAAS